MKKELTFTEEHDKKFISTGIYGENGNDILSLFKTTKRTRSKKQFPFLEEITLDPVLDKDKTIYKSIMFYLEKDKLIEHRDGKWFITDYALNISAFETMMGTIAILLYKNKMIVFSTSLVANAFYKTFNIAQLNISYDSFRHFFTLEGNIDDRIEKFRKNFQNLYDWLDKRKK